MGTQGREQLHSFQQIRLALAVTAHHQQPRRRELQVQLGDVAELVQLQAVQPDGSGAVGG
jgi:hypothetical protein